MTTIKRLAVPALALSLTALAYPALADQPGKDWMPMDQALRKLADAGFVEVRSLKADDGQWEGKAVKDGKAAKVTVDPRSGAVAEKAAKDERDED